MKTALAQIKEELGVDAVIMSNKKIPEGVEIMAAQDNSASSAPVSAPQVKSNNDLADDVVQLSQPPASSISSQVANARTNDSVQGSVNEEANEQHTSPADSLSALLARNVQQQNGATTNTNGTQSAANQAANNSNAMDLEQQLKQFTDRLVQQNQGQQNQGQQEQYTQHSEQVANNGDEFASPSFANQTSAHQTFAGNTTKANISGNSSVVSMDDFNQMKAEMASIRQLLEHQVSGLMWQDMAQKDPSRAMLIDKLVAMGINEQLADQVAGFVPNHLSDEQSWNSALQLLTSQINTTNNDIIHRGGVVSLVGPTGVGKTTTLAKLAARFAQIHGADELLLISTDTYRIGGFEQLETYGKIIGCSVKLAKDAQVLEALLQQYSNKKLVLIDTAGMGQRDMRLAENLSALVSNSRLRIRNYLVLAANTQQAVMQENVERFKKVPLCGCIFTKLDEGLSMGEIISTSIQNALPIGYLTDGQRVPEDIKVANAEKLVSLAEKIANKSAMKFNFVANKQPIASAAFG